MNLEHMYIYTIYTADDYVIQCNTHFIKKVFIFINIIYDLNIVVIAHILQ